MNLSVAQQTDTWLERSTKMDTQAPNGKLTNQTAAMRDTTVQFHPNTNARLHEKIGAQVIERGDGIHVVDNNGKRYIEAMSGLWSAALGFSEQRLINAATQQMQKLPFYHNFNHRAVLPTIELAEKLLSIAPVEMARVFFTNSGSEANDTALKMIWYRSNAMMQPEKKKIIALQRGYHGATVGAASLTGLASSHGAFDLPIAGIHHVTCPHYWREANEGESEADFATRLATELEESILKEGPETIAAFFAEPVMGAGGVVVPPETYWTKIQEVLGRYDILLVADEVICGFGRTGKMFGSETYGIRPDIMVLSKQLASSYQPIAALLLAERVYEPIADESAKRSIFGHGITTGGNPVASAVALENIKIIEERELVNQARRVGAYMQAELRSKLDGHPLVGEIRGVGLLAGVELVGDRETKAPHEVVGQLGTRAAALLMNAGIIVRAMGDTIALCPPLITAERDVDQILSAFPPALDAVLTEIG
jgi:4-aminobutyrate--pyruvate transaminase